MMETKELLQKCIEKDRTAWDVFIRQYSNLVTRSVRYKLNKLNANVPKGEYHDIVQEIFLLLWEKDKLTNVKDASSLKGWLAIVSLNFTTNYCKRKMFKNSNKTFSLDENPLNDKPEITIGSMIPSNKLNNEKTIETNELRSVLDKEISKLGHKQQLALKFNMYEGRTQKDISAIMNLPKNTVATLIRRGKNQLKENLKRTIDLPYKI